MRCSTIKGMAPDCTGISTLMLIYPDPETQKEIREPVCKPCGDGFVRRPRLRGRIVPLHVHMPESAFIEIVEGHRLVRDSEHEARCFDCGTTGSPTWFRFQTNGCLGRPESITVLHHSRETLQGGIDVRAREAARLWWDYAVLYLHTHVGDWRPVTGDAQYAAYFTFRDREYGLRHDLGGGQFGAEKLPNRGRPEPELVNVEDKDDYQQVVFHFHGLVNQYESTFFATWTPDREYIILYAPEGQISAMLRIDLDGTGTREWRLGIVTDAVCDAFGAVADIKFSSYIYE